VSAGGESPFAKVRKEGTLSIFPLQNGENPTEKSGRQILKKKTEEFGHSKKRKWGKRL